MTGFTRTGTILDEIVTHKAAEVAGQARRVPLAQVEEAVRLAPPPRDLAAALRRESIALIAEVKHASPSRGVLIDPFDPVALARAYGQGGAAAISVLTDERFFQGRLDHLKAVRQAVEAPVLRKDFIIDPYQVVEGRAAGADALLLIAAVLGDARLAELHGLITALGMSALVEVHTGAEMARALAVGAVLVGINNRDLRTFEVDLETTVRLARLAPPGVTLVAESGIHTAEDVRRMGEVGVHAVLVGEALVSAGPALPERLRAFSSQPRPGGGA